MIVYATEFFLLHLTFFVIYKLMLAKETQLSFLRVFLVGSTVLSLILPLIEVPVRSGLPTLRTETVILPVVTFGENAAGGSSLWVLVWIISAGFALRLLLSLRKIYRWYRKSEQDILHAVPIRKIEGLENSFTFLTWIFIDPKHFKNPEDIVHHEQGHAQKLHSIDLLFFHTLFVFFWWVPSVWWMVKELKVVHEYEADDYALKQNDQTYLKTLVHCTLKAHGMDLASSFDDAPIFNRLNFMKKMKKKISTWKVTSIVAFVAIAATILACEDNRGNEDLVAQPSPDVQGQALEVDSEEIFAVVDKSASFPGGMTDWGAYLSENMSYPRQAQNLGIEGSVHVQFVVEKDGSLTDVKVVKGIGAGCDAEAKRVVENSPSWDPGKIAGEPVRQKYIQQILFKLPS